MLTLSQIQTQLHDLKTEVVASATGLHPNTVRAIRNGLKRDIKLSTVTLLSDYLESRHVAARAAR